MTKDQLLAHLQATIPQELQLRGGLLDRLRELAGGQIAKAIVEAISKLLKSGVIISKEDAIAAAREYFSNWAEGDNPRISNWIENLLEMGVWMSIEWAINKLYPV